GREWTALRDSNHGPYRFQAVHLAPAEFPSSWLELAPVDLVAINGRGWGALDGTQRRAVRQWVELGGAVAADEPRLSGRAILCGELPAEWRDPDSAALTAIQPARVVMLRPEEWRPARFPPFP